MDFGTFSSKTSPDGSATRTTPSAVSWEDLSAQTMPCLTLQAEAGPVRVWLPGQGHGRHGGFSMLNTQDWRNDASVCSLSRILETGPIPRRYYLSGKACLGILRRAEKRGKELPTILRQALQAVAGELNEPEKRADKTRSSLSPSDSGGGNTSGPIDVAACLTAKGQRVDFEVETFIADITGTLPAGGNSTGGDRQPSTSADTADTMLIAHTLRAMGHSTSHANAGEQMAVPIQAGALRENPESGPDGAGFREDVAYTLEARAEVQAVAFDLRGREGGAQFEGPHDTANIRAASGGSSRSYVAEQWAVRRLTVTECCRLQGYPDDWTLIEHGARRTVEDDEAKYLIAKGAHVVRDNAGRLRTNAAADGPQYKALGNAWAVACVRPIALEILKGLAA